MTDENLTDVWAGQVRSNVGRTESIKVFGNYGYGSGGNLFSVSVPDMLKTLAPCGMSEMEIAEKYPVILSDPRTEGPPMSTPPARRIRIDQFTPAEKAIWDATRAVEAAGCDTRLTAAINKLAEARDLVADFVDGVPMKPKPVYDLRATEGSEGWQARGPWRDTKEEAERDCQSPPHAAPEPIRKELTVDDLVRHTNSHLHYLRGTGIIVNVFEEECAVAWSAPGSGVTITRKIDLQYVPRT